MYTTERPKRPMMNTVQVISVTVASALSAEIQATATQDSFVRLSATADLFYVVSPAATGTSATLSNGILLPAGAVEVIRIEPNQKIAAIRATADGILSIAVLEA